MNTASLLANITTSHRRFDGASTEHFCKIAHNRMKKLIRNEDARSIRDYNWLANTTKKVGYPFGWSN